MKRCFRARGVTYYLLYVFLAWLVYETGPWVYAMLKTVWPMELLSLKIILLPSCLFLLWAFFEMWRGLETQIVITNEAIAIEKPFYSRQMAWSDIEEVCARRGRYQRSLPSWDIYLSARGSPKKMWIPSPFLHQTDELIPLLFEKAKSARFIQLIDESWIPLISRWKSYPWERYDITFW